MYDCKYTIRDASGSQQPITISLETINEAYQKGLSLPQHLAQTIPTDSEKYGTVFEQCMASAGIFTRADRNTGIRPPTIAEMLSGKSQGSMGPIVAPDGAGSLDPAGRLLFAPVILEAIDLQLRFDDNAYSSVFNRMVARTQNVQSDLYQQPSVDVTGPRGSRMQPIAQGAEPTTIIKISLSNKAYTIPTYSIGLEITDQAQLKMAIDQVGMMVSQQAAAQRSAWINEAFLAMVSGDADRGLSALSSVTAVSLDPASTTGVTRLAWIKFLMSVFKDKTIDWVVGGINDYVELESRAGRPTVQTDQGTDLRLDTVPVIAGIRLPSQVNFFPLIDEAGAGILPAKTIVGIDSRKAIQRVIYVGATYSAIEQFVMRRTTALRFDIAELYTRLLDVGFSVLTYS